MSETIKSPRNERLKLLRRLAERRGRRQEGLFSTEGEDLLLAGLTAGFEPAFVLVADGAGVELGALPAGAEPLAVEASLLDQVSSLGSGCRAIAAWPLPDPALGADQPCVYLHGVADPGNVGTIIRTAAALGEARVVLGPGCADPFGPKAVRASMGALFARPPISADVSVTPAPRLALDAHGGSDLEQAIESLGPATLCLGAEREGLDRATLEHCEERATIPIQGGAESLNVAAVAAIALHRVCSAAGSGGGAARWAAGGDDA